MDSNARWLVVGVGIGLLGLAAYFAAARGWLFGAKATVAGVLGLSYLLVGSVALRTDAFEPTFRRSIAMLPVAYVALFGMTELAQYLATGTVSPTRGQALRALWATLLGYPAGLGYVFGVAETPEQKRAVAATALGCIAAGTAVAAVTWTSIWPSSLAARVGLVATGGLVLVTVGGGVASLLARATDAGDRPSAA